MTKLYTNPILRGFNPDASILRVGDDYYIATSTFEWWPGVEIYHSTDLINWTVVAEPVDRPSQANLLGNYNSGSLWAPALSYDHGRFYLIYTDVKTTGIFKDTLNYLIEAPAITGPWSEPVFLNASGFDPALFHDDDGRHYLMNMLYDHRLDHDGFAGVVMQEYDLAHHQLVGARQKIFQGTQLGNAEGPQMLKRNGWYYLICAAGGTGYSHAATIARARNIWGPYTVAPNTPLMTTKPHPDSPLQKCGHVSLVEITPDEWYATFITARPLKLQRGNCTLGRETGLTPIRWQDDWPYLLDGGEVPPLQSPLPSIAQDVEQRTDFSETIDFTTAKALPISLKSLRGPLGDHAQLTPAGLVLRGQQSITSLHRQSLLARRWQAFHFTATTTVDFAPTNFQTLAGLVLFYDTDNWQYLSINYDETKHTRYLQVMVDAAGQAHYASPRIPLPAGLVTLRAEVDHATSQFSYQLPDNDWQLIGDGLPADQLSDDYVKAQGKLAFTGAMVGICAQDLNDHTSFATFKTFDYQERR
ncbi:MAG: glycoside hydrolase family 43 protein [Lactobacillus sp.]|jgi:xylan 1,4-beta-xylosidase|uniref:Glycoside hydrolase family 43 protein n=1 Tax=Lacticaseibacillus suilingensis TaxID=2799577 RepID=A0ABW4BGT7_9LACO|nr:glycoside hydrolase family 43 protein [Lacticaseibacillus suilingensis]MCI1895032.1 glycoside hydrolase family 43 protein [Lactobacillus sp.]MCI1917704.1 glycoside hydrolase family 43 protein [Lactobacillus sp.]MCI1942424.1 glycoside hydrolase family 43 protein [Lactobacillus sp.]MCI1972928.1 glycoside hydrolase family 43 protein [Lactobacillus sp.]MCI2017758.1 glycoside hydrolase family 43 protein [Lactobacillus sp.]